MIYKPGLVCLTETWFDNNFNSTVTIDDYYLTCSRMDREDGQHGGVAILHKPNIHCSPLARKNKSDFICAAEVSIGDRNLLIVCVYFPPRSSLYRPSWEKLTKTLLSVVAIFSGDIIITGDFNEPTTDWASFDSRHSDMDCFFDFLIERNFQQLISSPTHIAGNVLDLAFTNSDSISLSLGGCKQVEFFWSKGQRSNLLIELLGSNGMRSNFIVFVVWLGRFAPFAK